MIYRLSALSGLSIFTAIVAFVLPSPQSILVFLGATGLGIGMGAGSGYAAFIQRTSKARVQEYREWDEARRDSTLAQLEEAIRNHEETLQRVEMLEREIEQLKSALATERETVDRLSAAGVHFALSMLCEKGLIVREVSTP